MTGHKIIEATPIDTAPAPPAKSGGYEVSRFNAVRHGILSRHACLPWEDQTAFNSLLDGLVSEYQPQGVTEEHLVMRIAENLWRVHRIRLAEAGVYESARQATLARIGGAEQAQAHNDMVELVYGQVLAEGFILDRLEKLSRYESHASRQFQNALAVLLRLQELRRVPQPD